MSKHESKSAETASLPAKSPANKKQQPTPTRREREAQNLRPLVPEDRKQAKREMQAKVRVEQAKAREGLAKGDDRYLRPTERGPQKRFMRNYIDARYSIGELLLPMMFLVIFATFIPSQSVGIWAMSFIWAFLAVCVLEAVMVANIIKRKIAAVVGKDKVEKGIVIGTVARSLQLRVMRMPKSQVKRGAKIEFTGK
ncbi:DUF3043 domain-containing protein [Pseudoclavibacter helvolus]|uniref:DUF3043 domain-containing protein n=1 Tax=Pseudoclavibacter helvolus TaxID=255205 RepID=UPI003C762F2B